MAATIVPPRIYTRVYGTLLALTLLTWGAFHLHLPHSLALVVALTIAMSKALLVVLFFMHVRYSTRLTWVVVVASIFWLGILLALTFSDYLTRAWRTYG